MPTTGLFLALALIAAGGLLTWAHNFIGNEVHTQLAAQQIFFPPANSQAIKAPEFAAMRQYAGQQLTTGAQAEVYADHFIANHLKVIGGGKTYSQLSAKAMAQPDNAKLAAQVHPVFRGKTLRRLLLNAYAFGTMGMIAGIAAIAAFIAAAVMLILGGLGLTHARRVSPDADILARRPANAPNPGTPAADHPPQQPAAQRRRPCRHRARPLSRPIRITRSKVPPRLVMPAAGGRHYDLIVEASASVDEPRYRCVLAGRGDADVDMKDLVIAEHRRVRVWPAPMIGERPGDVEHAAGEKQHSGCGAGVDPHPRQREAACAAEPDEHRARRKFRRARPHQAEVTAASVSTQIAIRQASPAPAGAESRKAGVAVPAMARKKIIAWSRRCRRCLQTAVQVPR